MLDRGVSTMMLITLLTIVVSLMVLTYILITKGFPLIDQIVTFISSVGG